MEALGLRFSPIIASNLSHTPTKWNYLSGFAPVPIATCQSLSNNSVRLNCKGVTRMQVVEEEYEVKQMRDMAAARKRWEALVREGKVKVLTPKEAGYAIQLSNKTLLDVRPSVEHQKAWVKGSTWIPIFEVDDGLDAGTLSRKITGFMMGGWWSGVPTLSLNKDFLPKVAEKFPKDTDLILACQKGLRFRTRVLENTITGHIHSVVNMHENLYLDLADPLQLVNYCIMLVMKIFSGFKEAWRPLKKRNLRGKGPSPLSWLELAGFQNFLVGLINRELQLPRKAGDID